MEPFAAFSFLLLSAFVYVLVFITRTVAEYARPSLKVSKFWLDLFLPILPALLGALFGALVKGFGYPAEIGDSPLARVALGTVAGFFSATAYRIVKAFLASKAGIQQDHDKTE